MDNAQSPNRLNMVQMKSSFSPSTYKEKNADLQDMMLEKSKFLSVTDIASEDVEETKRKMEMTDKEVLEEMK